jgi:hypothetical protein
MQLTDENATQHPNDGLYGQQGMIVNISDHNRWQQLPYDGHL